MKLNARVLVFVLLLSLAPLPLMPNAAAVNTYTWVVPDTVEQSGGADGGAAKSSASVMPITVTWVDGSQHESLLVAWEEQIPNDENYITRICNFEDNPFIAGTEDKCDVNTSIGLFDSDANNVDEWNARIALNGLYVACGETQGTSTGLELRKSTDGRFWTTPRETGIGEANVNTCDVDGYDSNNYAMVGDKDSTADVMISLSSDGGVTWGVPSIVTGSFSPAVVRIAMKNATHWIVMALDSTLSYQACRTIDGGAVWACQTILTPGPATGGGMDFGLYYVGNETWVAAVQDSDTVVHYFHTDNAGIDWFDVTVASGLTAVRGVDIVRVNNTHSFISVARAADDQYVYHTVNNGQTWVQDVAWNPTTAGLAGFGVTSAGGTGITYADGKVAAVFAVNDNTPGVSVVGVAYSDFSAPLVFSNSASVTDLVGFDVDPTGSIVIARTELGENVQVFNAQTLGTSVSGTIDTNCATGTNPYEDGVMSKNLQGGNDAQLVAFLNCDASGDAQYLSIRQSDGSIPTIDQFDGCEPVDAGGVGCHYNIDLTDFDEPIDSGLGQLGQVKDWPVDYSNQGSFLGSIVGRTAWAWASQQCDDPPGPAYCGGSEPGMVGVATYTARVTDPANTDSVQHHPDQDVDDFCLGLDGSNYYLASVVSGQPGHTWTVTFSETDGDALDSAISNNPSSFGSSGFGIACGGGQLLHQNGDSDVQLLSRTGVFIDEVQPGGGDERGVTLSEEFVGPAGAAADRGSTCTTALEGTGNCLQYGAYLDTVAGEGVIINVTGGSIVEVGRFTMPSGTFHSIRMDRLAQNVWVATTTTIARFEVTSVTTVEPVNIPGEEDGGGVVDGDGLFAGSGATIGTAFGVGAFGGNLFLGAVLMGIVAYGVGIGYGNAIDGNTMQPRALRVNPWAAAVGAAVGFLMAWGFGFFSTAVVFSMVALVVLIIGVKLMVSRG